MLPADAHLHTEWSWDAPIGFMAGACARAEQLGLPAVAFTDHADYVSWQISPEVADYVREMGGQLSNGVFTPPELDLDGYLGCLDSCRERFPGLRIQSGVELGEPHWHRRQAADLARTGAALEINTRLPLDPLVVGWWRQEGGAAVSFGSDAHDPRFLAQKFAEATGMAMMAGFGPGPDAGGLWIAS